MTHTTLDFCDFLDDLDLDTAQFEGVYDPSPEDWKEYEEYLNELDKVDTLERELVFAE